MPNPTPSGPSESNNHSQPRRHWISILAKSTSGQIEALWSELSIHPTWTHIRPPETGMVMVRGRSGGDGKRFNLGEMTMTRAAVRLVDGPTGFGYVQGRSKRHAELVAVIDAMLQLPQHRSNIEDNIVQPLAREQEERRDLRSRKAAGTKVEFFTMTRGDG